MSCPTPGVAILVRVSWLLPRGLDLGGVPIFAEDVAEDSTDFTQSCIPTGRLEHSVHEVGVSGARAPHAFQTLMAALCRSYGTQLEAGAQFLPLANQTSASPTEVMTTTSALLKAANLAVFELGMWQSWTGR